MSERIQRLIAALWLGSAFFAMLAASAAFRAAPTPTAAADVVGAMLTRWHYIALFAPLLLFALELRRVRFGVLVLLFVAILLAAMQGFADLRIRAIRNSSDVPISYLSRRDPLRRQFGMLHGLSSGLLLLQALVAAGVVMARPRPEDETEPEPVLEPLAKEGLMSEDREDTTIYEVVVNAEEQYSIWPADRELPLGWNKAGFSGPKADCLAYIKEVWTDMRPKSLREKMEEQGL